MNEGRQPLGYEARAPAAATESGWADLRHTVTELLRILLLRKWMFFVPFCLILTGALLFSHRLPRQYKASTVFERRTDVATARLAREGSPHKFRALLWSFNFDIVDREAMGEVVDNLGWSKDFPRDAQGRLTPEGEKMRGSLAASCTEGVDWSFHLQTDDLDQIELNYTADEPDKPRLLVEEIRDTYIRRTQERIIRLLEDARQYYQRKLQESQAEEDRLAEQKLRFEIEYPGIDPSRPGTIAEKIALLENQRSDLERRAWELGAELATRESFVSGTPAPLPQQAAVPEMDSSQEMVPNPRRADLERRIRQSETEISDLQLTRHMTEEHPKIVSLRRGMQAAAATLATEPERVPRQLALAVAAAKRGSGQKQSLVGQEVWELQKARVEMEIGSLQAKRGRMQEDLSAVGQQIVSLGKMQESIFERQREYGQLREDLGRAQGEVKTWTARFEELQRTIDVESHNKDMGFSVVVPASRSTRPVFPRFMTVMTLSVMLALGVGVAVVLLAELMDRKFRTINQVVRSTGLPILESIGEILTPAERRTRFLRHAVLKPALAGVLALLAGVSAYAAYTSIEHPGTWSRWKSHLVLNWNQGDGEEAPRESA